MASKSIVFLQLEQKTKMQQRAKVIKDSLTCIYLANIYCNPFPIIVS